MTKEQKNDVIELLKGKFNQYSNFYITDTESLTVAQIGQLRRACFNKNVEMKVAKNTLIKKALESLDAERYTGVYDSLNNVTALMFSENPKDPAVILSSFRKETKKERPVLKAAFINGDVFTGDNSLVALTNIKTKNEMIGEVIGLLQSPAKRVIAALLNHAENGSTAPVAAAIEAVVEETVVVAEAAPEVAPESTPEATAPEAPAEGTDAPAENNDEAAPTAE
jgi:large subunit ribosomal protein L10